MRGILVVTALAVVLTGCATKRYGRLQPLTTAEQQVYSCREIEVEIAKVEAFRQQVADGAKINAASAMGFLGDFGIGNANEKNQADRTAAQRMNQLLALKAQNRCGFAESAAYPAPRPLAPPAGPNPTADRPPEGVGNSRVRCVTCRD